MTTGTSDAEAVRTNTDFEAMSIGSECATMEEHLATLRSAIADDKPCCCGTLAMHHDDLILFYGKDEEARPQ